MDVDVDVARIELEREGRQRELIPREERPEGFQQRLRQERVAHHPPVDHQVDVVTVGSRERGRRHDPVEARSRSLPRHVDEA
jgi:hypothetical protein